MGWINSSSHLKLQSDLEELKPNLHGFCEPGCVHMFATIKELKHHLKVADGGPSTVSKQETELKPFSCTAES